MDLQFNLLVATHGSEHEAKTTKKAHDQAMRRRRRR